MAGIRSVPIEMYNTITVVTGNGNWNIINPINGNIWAICDVNA